MNPFISLFITIGTCLAVVSCDKTPLVPEAQVCFEYSLDTSKGEDMTKATNADIFSEFNAKIKTAELVAQDYMLSLTEITNGREYEFQGSWNAHNMVTVPAGTYRVEGRSTAPGGILQDKCSLIFEDNVTIDASSNIITLPAKYDCFLLIFNGSSFSSLKNVNGDATEDFFDFNSYKYAFVNGQLYTEDRKASAHILGNCTDGALFKAYTGSLTFEKGKYYVYNSVAGGFNIPEMEAGGGNNGNEQIGGEEGSEATGNNMTLHLSNPGTLYKMCRKYYDNVDTDQEYGEEIWGDITSVTLTGTIDARDFSTLKWNFRNLQNVDLGGVKIAAYSGPYGTNEGYYDGGIYSVYNANEIPIGAFFYWMNNNIREFPEELFDEGMPSLRSIKLPEGIKVIRRNAFARAYNLKEINIPEGVETIEMVAFRYCTSIEKLYLPSTIHDIGWLAFTDMYSLKEVHIKAKHAPSENQSFGNYPDGDNRGTVIVGDVNYSEKTNAILYVPVGSKDNYKDWEKYFVRIEEE